MLVFLLPRLSIFLGKLPLFFNLLFSISSSCSRVFALADSWLALRGRPFFFAIKAFSPPSRYLYAQALTYVKLVMWYLAITSCLVNPNSTKSRTAANFVS
jgi:hypothetical protein